MNNSFESPLDKIIREAREQGAFDHLPGTGEPLRWEDESMVPEDQRMAHRLLKNNHFTLDWIALGQELDAAYEAARNRLNAVRAGTNGGQTDYFEWQAAVKTFRGTVHALNIRVIGYNLRTPHEQFHKRPYSAEIEGK